MTVDASCEFGTGKESECFMYSKEARQKGEGLPMKCTRFLLYHQEYDANWQYQRMCLNNRSRLRPDQSLQ